MNLATERIVVTGGDGFLGRCVQAELKRRGVPAEHIGVPQVNVGGAGSFRSEIIEGGRAGSTHDHVRQAVAVEVAAVQRAAVIAPGGPLTLGEVYEWL